MTIFRIIYMFLFLVFILMFQISYHFWRKLMYTFWIIVIIYSMINLILIYIYQFDNFSKTIETYLLINEKLQHDLGLEPYLPADLFVKLLTPTLFLIITIMQVHYFHKDFMALSDLKTRTDTVKEAESSRHSLAGASTMKDDIPQLPLEGDRPPSPEDDDKSATEADHSIEMSSMNTTAKKPSQRRSSRSRSYAAGTSAGAAGERVPRVGGPLVPAAAAAARQRHRQGLRLPRPPPRQDHLHRAHAALCAQRLRNARTHNADNMSRALAEFETTESGSNDTNYFTDNNAEWLGFQKATRQKPLVVLLKGYIGLIAVFTFFSLITYRQQNKREMEESFKESEKLMFPEITRKEADIDLVHCIKYLMNYGFYKFGVEVRIICAVFKFMI
ncbi:hypothetical protein ACJJTC_011880 [Scirpophaga incertulas]